MILNTFTILFLVNSVTILILILNQNESAKDTISNSASANSSQRANPLQSFTWVCVILECIFLLIKTKIVD